ncbi:MAG: hypothetical protein KDD36_06345 [Flavobacteriales bacterium]|nr:hypothetical protein [Flavobacteriales bacterium]
MRNTILTFLTACVFVACQKDPIVSEYPNVLVVGDPDEVLITDDSLVVSGGYNHGEFIDVDVDKDGVNDIRISAAFTGSPGMGVTGSAYLRSINEQLGFAYIPYKVDQYTKEYKDTIKFMGSDSELDVTEYTCENLPGYQYLSTTEERRYRFEPGSSVRMNDAFDLESERIQISPIDNNISETQGGDLGGIGIIRPTWRTVRDYSHCGRVDYESKSYVVFRIDGRLGWLKLTATGGLVTIYEYAVQKKP